VALVSILLLYLLLQRDQELAAAAAAAASARDASSLPTSPTGRGLRPHPSGGPNSTGAGSNHLQGLGSLVVPSHTGVFTQCLIAEYAQGNQQQAGVARRRA
jgi:hypothetical protein